MDLQIVLEFNRYFIHFFGIYGYLIAEKVKELSISSIVLGIGFITLFKTGAEMFEIHRKDKNTIANNGNRNYFGFDFVRIHSKLQRSVINLKIM